MSPAKLYCALLLCAVYLGFAGLDHCLFWDDEALVALHAKNFLATGKWTAWTGQNLAAYGNGILLDHNLETLDAKPQYWLAAASFGFFGISTWAGRFPFAVVGLYAMALLLPEQMGVANLIPQN
jgi:4-amino-4-deoxy-L-arabinose transferase-like glycosyltransferase